MDKNKNRTDLLAAGKKKLQQFRQKKDTKGDSSSHGKSSRKSSKSEKHSAEAATGAAVSMASSQVADGKVETDTNSNLDISESSELESLANSSTPDFSAPSVDSSQLADNELALQAQEVGEHDSKMSVQNEGESSQDIGADRNEDVSLGTSHSLGSEGRPTTHDREGGVRAETLLVSDTKDMSSSTSQRPGSEGETADDHMSSSIDTVSIPAPATSAMGETFNVDERDGEDREVSFLVPENIPNTSLMQTREYQVGAVQEVDGLDVKESGQTSATEIEAGQIGKHHDMAIAGHVKRNLEREALPVSPRGRMLPQSSDGHGEKEVVGLRMLLSSDEKQSRKETVLSVKEESDQQNSPVGSVCLDKNSDQLSMGAQELNLTGPSDVSPVCLDKNSDESSMGAQDLNLAGPSDVSPICDVNSISLLQLTELVRGLSEEEYNFLLKSRTGVSSADPTASSLILPDQGFPRTFERLKEELFLAYFMKDIFNLQLAEQLKQQLESDSQRYKLIDELSELRALHGDVSKESQQLSEELSSCQVELQDIASKNVELQNENVLAKAEIEALSASVREVQNSYEMSQKYALDLSRELDDCRGLLSALQADNEKMNESVASMIDEKTKLVEENEHHLSESKKLSTEIADMKISVEGLKTENLNLNGGLSLLTEERNKIEAERQHLAHEIDRLSMELVEKRDLVASLQVENSNLNRSLALSADQTKMLEEDKQVVLVENQRLLSQITVLQEKLSTENGERMKCEVELNEVTVQLEQVIMENISLKVILELHQGMTQEIGNEYIQLISQYEELSSQAQIAGNLNEDHQSVITKDPLLIAPEQDEKGDPGGQPLNLFEQEVLNNSIGFVALKMHLDEVDNTLEKLGKAIDHLHSNSLSSGRSGGKVSSVGVSNLIKAFESKSQDESEVEEKDSDKCQPTPDPFMFTKGQIGNLRETLAKCRLDVQNVGALLTDEHGSRKIGEAKYGELQDQFEALNQHCLNLEASNIELAVQYEATLQLLGEIQEKKHHLEELCETVKQEDTLLKANNYELYEKLGNFQSRISELFTEMQDVQQSSDQMASDIGMKLDNLQKEVTDRAMFLEQSWNATVTEIVEAVEKLDESVVEALPTTISASSLDGLDINHKLAVSVNAAAAVILDLRKKLEAAYSEHEMACSSLREVGAKCDDLHQKNELAVSILHKIYCDLTKLVLNHCGSLDEGMVDLPGDALPDLLNYSSYHTIMSSLEGVMIEKMELESVTTVFKSELMQREKQLEELSVKCAGLDSVSQLIEDIEGVLNVEDTDTKMNKEPLLHLVSLVSSLIEKSREADMQSHIAKGSYGSVVLELTELQEKMHYLDILCLEHENEVFILKESLRDAEGALVVARSDLYKKTSELEQAEQRVSSIREKLSIAVAKGKGLVVQRDGLKHSLAETSSELERCLQELQLKDTRLHEVETKLKTYAEAGERAEALESELSYIRHSANALRESFLLKDSVLQRIEEILEDLELPEQFHSQHIIEKIDWLARSAAVNSLSTNDYDQKSSAEGGSAAVNSLSMNDYDQKSSTGGSNSDTGFVVMDAWKDDGQLQSDSGGDFRKKFENLESKYIELAEQNEMLEQSLMERNSLVRRWEELVNRIDMPSHLRSMETDDRIEWLGRALVEANHHIDSLQMKIEKYDSYYGLLHADLEGFQRRASALQADLKAVTSERDYLSERVESLLSECQKLAMHTEQAESENEKLHHEITSLEERLSALQADLKAVTSERDYLSERVESLMSECQKLAMHTEQAGSENEKLHHEITSLEERLEQKGAVEERLSALQADLKAVTSERDYLSERVESLMSECQKLAMHTEQAGSENEKLHHEITSLEERLEQKGAVEERLSALQADLKAVTSERDYLSERVESLMSECQKLAMHTEQAESENEKLHHEITSLKERLEQNGAVEEQILIVEGKIRKLHDLVGEVLPRSETENLVSRSESIDSLEVLLRMLLENYAALSSTKPVNGNALDERQIQNDDATFDEARSIDMSGQEEPAVVSLKKDLEEALHELMLVKEERDRNLEYQLSLSGKLEALSKKTEELQELLNQEEQKSASVREKLNIAVRKGKSLVQQRDSLKQTIEEMNSEMAHLKSEINNQKDTLAEYAEKFKDLSTYPDRLEALESESLLLKNHLAETEHHLQEREYTYKMILNKLNEIEVSGEGDVHDPIKKLEWVGKLCSDLHASVASLEQESRKSKRASELLLAELNEVQERNDAFQEELANISRELLNVRKERDSAEAAKVEALSRLEKLSALQMEERNNYFSEVMELRSSVNQLHTDFFEVDELLANAFFMNLESFRNLESGLESCMKGNNAANVVYSSVTRGHDGIQPSSTNNKKRAVSVDSWSDFDKIDHFDSSTVIETSRRIGHQLHEFLMELTSLRESINTHSSLTQEQGKALSELVVTIQQEMTSQRESCEIMKKEIGRKEGELAAVCGNIAYLYEACTKSVVVIENGKAELVGSKIASTDLGTNLKAAPFVDDGVPSSGQVQLMSEEFIKTLADRLLLAAQEFATVKTDFLDANQKETKAAIANLQRELQEKDVQREKICMELVNQIKNAEAAVSSCTEDLQSSRIREHNFEKQVGKLEAEKKILEERVNELQDTQAAAAELEEKIRSLTDLLAAKDQEIEALMHALDEEETQMEELTKKIEELEKSCQFKNLEIENLEASRGKLTKKLSITVSKFDELHHLSASLLAEVEKLQSQLQERDADISFLRQEVTRCTNDVLLASQTNKKRSSDEIFEFLVWIDMMVSREGMHEMRPDVSDITVNEYKEMLHKKLISVISELEDLRAVAESKEASLQVERSKVEELTHKAETLELSLRQKESQLNLLEGVEESGRGAGASTNFEILEVEPVGSSSLASMQTENWTSAGTSMAPQVRSLRKGNNDHVAIAVDADPSSTSRIEDEDDDKVHGFKSLTTSRIVPRFTRPLTDMVDGLWVSCDRALMRQPTLRLGIIIYWAVMHLLLAFSVV